MANDITKYDAGHQLTERRLSRLEKKIGKAYAEATKEIQKTIDKYWADFKGRDEVMAQRLDDGKIDADYYKQWRMNQIGRGERFEAMRDDLAERIYNVNKVTNSYINDETPGIYSLNWNYTGYVIEKYSKDIAWTIYDEQTVKRLVLEEPNLMPYYPEARAIRKGYDLAFSAKVITNTIRNSILQGRTLKQMADTLQSTIIGMNRASAVRAARTAFTGAQNGGRIAGMESAQKMGIDVQKRWLSTSDARTRDSHATINGEVQPVKKKFSNGLMYPGDRDGRPAEVYNCRCTLTYVVDGKNANVSNDTPEAFQEWEDKQPKAASPTFKPAQSIEGKNKVINGKTVKAGNTVKKVSGKKENLVIQSCKVNKVEYRKVEPLDRKLTEKEIIERVSGGDMTKGSCASLSWAYVANKHGLNVLDFRDGISRRIFAKNMTSKDIASFKGVKSYKAKNTNDFKSANEVLKNAEKGKEYVLLAGEHSSVIRYTEKGFEYLELQSPTSSGWHKLTNDILKTRFGCKKSHSLYGHKIEFETIMVDIDSLKNNYEFRRILGYINTAESKQKKGVSGSAK